MFSVLARLYYLLDEGGGLPLLALVSLSLSIKSSFSKQSSLFTPSWSSRFLISLIDKPVISSGIVAFPDAAVGVGLLCAFVSSRVVAEFCLA